MKREMWNLWNDMLNPVKFQLTTCILFADSYFCTHSVEHSPIHSWHYWYWFPHFVNCSLTKWNVCVCFLFCHKREPTCNTTLQQLNSKRLYWIPCCQTGCNCTQSLSLDWTLAGLVCVQQSLPFPVQITYFLHKQISLVKCVSVCSLHVITG